MDRINEFRQTIESGNVAIGAMSTSPPSTSTIEMMGNLGLDYVYQDFEHIGPSPYDSVTVEHLARAAEVSGTELIARLHADATPSLVRKVLDTGIRNVVIPRVETADEIRPAVKATRYEYQGNLGSRGAVSSRVTNWGADTDYKKEEDENVWLGITIENTKAVSNLDEILQIPELGFVRIGTGDLSLSASYTSDEPNQSANDYLRTIEEKCRTHNIPFGRAFNDAEKAYNAIERGYNIVGLGKDLTIAQTILRDRFNTIQSRM